MQFGSAVRATPTTEFKQPLLALTALVPNQHMVKLLLIGRPLVAAEKGCYRDARWWVDKEFPNFDWSLPTWERTRSFEEQLDTRRVPYNTRSVFDLLQMVGGAARHCALTVSSHTSVSRIFMNGGGHAILQKLLTKHRYYFPEYRSLEFALKP